MKKNKKTTSASVKKSAVAAEAVQESQSFPVIEEVPVVEAVASAVVESEPVEGTALVVKEPKVVEKKSVQKKTKKTPVKKGEDEQKSKSTKTPKAKEGTSLLNKGGKVDVPSALGLFVQYQGGEVDMAAIVEAVKEDFKAANGHTKLTSLKLYVKPEEHTAYYVANDSTQGKIIMEF